MTLASTKVVVNENKTCSSTQSCRSHHASGCSWCWHVLVFEMNAEGRFTKLPNPDLVKTPVSTFSNDVFTNVVSLTLYFPLSTGQRGCELQTNVRGNIFRLKGGSRSHLLGAAQKFFLYEKLSVGWKAAAANIFTLQCSSDSSGLCGKFTVNLMYRAQFLLHSHYTKTRCFLLFFPLKEMELWQQDFLRALHCW